MGLIDKLYYYTWNIGFVERSINDIVLSKDTEVKVNWVKHNYNDRFFADPFILDADDKKVRVLVEDFPYYDKKGMISLLTVDRRTWELVDRKIILKQPFHMSYPFIYRENSKEKWVAPEASQSGCLYRYTFDEQTLSLENQIILHDEPLLDSTIIEYHGKYWLFCTKLGENSNKDLFIYYSNQPEGPWKSHNSNPVVSDNRTARPAGYLVKVEDELYRVTQKCDKTYGESVNVTKITCLNEDTFDEVFVKEIKSQKCKYSHAFHTINGYKDICVVDGIAKEFSPLRRLWYELCNLCNF